MELYQKRLKVLASMVDYKSEMKISSFMNLFQECCIAHTEELGMGREKTFDKGFLWIIISEHILINKMPKYDEDIVLECYPNETLHYFFPRCIVVKNVSGEELIKANALWALIDKNTRTFIDPEENGIVIKGENTPNDVMPLIKLKMPEMDKKISYKATYSMTDINGHLGNTHYIDLLLDTMYEDNEDINVKEVSILFKKEITRNKRLFLNIKKEDDKYFFASKYFDAKIRY